MADVRYDPIHPDVPSIPEPPETSLTPNYKLLLNLGNTITSWLTIFNTNMSIIDNAMHNLELRTSIDGEVPPEAIDDIVKLNAAVSLLQKTLEPIPEQITNIQTILATNTSDIGTLKINYTNLDTIVSTLKVTLQSLQESVEKLQNNYTSLDERVTALENKS